MCVFENKYIHVYMFKHIYSYACVNVCDEEHLLWYPTKLRHHKHDHKTISGSENPTYKHLQLIRKVVTAAPRKPKGQRR